MSQLGRRITLILFACGLCAYSRDAARTYDLLKKGGALSAKDVERLEDRLKHKASDEEARIQLLSYYATPTPNADLSDVKAARLRHILWLVENDPKEGFGLFQVSTGVYRLHCQGDDLADADGFKQASEVWLVQVQRYRGDAAVRRNAVDAIRFCMPERAEALLLEADDRSGLGQLYAGAVLGITGETYLNRDPSGSDPAFRHRPFAAKALRALEDASDKAMLASAAGTLLGSGATLWADGKLDWDYTSIGNSLLAKAMIADPSAVRLWALPTTLPARGERPPATLRIGGNVQAAQLIRKVTPIYPPIARDLGIQGTVRMSALIGLDGRILRLHAESGPSELVPASLEAAGRWEYKPTLLNGKPCYVITLIDVNYTLSR